MFGSIWRRITDKTMEQSSGKLETAFFESVYRIAYAFGLSFADEGLAYTIYSSIVKTIIGLFVGGEVWYLFNVSSSLDAVIDNINVTVIHVLVVYRYTSMTSNKHIYKKLARSMKSPFFDTSTPERKKILEFWIHLNDKYFKILLALGSACLSVWYIYPLIDDVEYNMVAAIRLPFDYQTPALYAASYSVVLLMFHFISYFVVINDLLMQVHLMNLLCQFTILGHCFENILKDCSTGFKDIDAMVSSIKFRQLYTERLGNMVDQHKFILSNATELRTALSAPMLGQLAASGMLICLAGYQVTATMTDSIPKFLMSLLYLCYNLYGFYLLCRWCDEIKMKSEQIRDAVYFSGWERVSTVPGVRLRLMLVASRASRPLVLTAGGLYDVSLMSYTTLVKTSYSALTVLLRVRRHDV